MAVLTEQNSTPSWLEWAVAEQPLAGQTLSGDLHLVQPFASGALLAVVDGVGHGEEATAAARTAVAVLVQHANDPVIALVSRCHQALAQSRGVVMTLASVQPQERTITWIGVGNVEGWLVRAGPASSHPRESVLLRGGLVGYQLPALQASVLPLAAGDLLIFATDGIRGGFAEAVNQADRPKQLADRILSCYFKGTDDALVLVARYLGHADE